MVIAILSKRPQENDNNSISGINLKALDSGKVFSRKKFEAGTKERLKETHC